MDSQPTSVTSPEQNGAAQAQPTQDQAGAPTAIFSSDITVLTGLGYGGNKAVIQWGSDNRIRLYEAVGARWSLAFDIAPNEIKKYGQVYGLLNVTLSNTSLSRRKFRLMFDELAYKNGIAGQTASGGLVGDILRTGASSRGMQSEDNSGITWWVETFKRFGVSRVFWGNSTNRSNHAFNIAMIVGTVGGLVVALIIVLVSAM